MTRFGRVVHSIRSGVKDDFPRIWCNRCSAQQKRAWDMKRHYKGAHPAFAEVEKQYWAKEPYKDSRHGVGPAADAARARTKQIIAAVGDGQPVISLRRIPTHTKTDTCLGRFSALTRAAFPTTTPPGYLDIPPSALSSPTASSDSLSSSSSDSTAPLSKALTSTQTPASKFTISTTAHHDPENDWTLTAKGCMEKAGRKFARARQCVEQAEEDGYPETDKTWVLELGKAKFKEGQLWAGRASRCEEKGDEACMKNVMVVE